jgi:hypothetical protein
VSGDPFLPITSRDRLNEPIDTPSSSFGFPLLTLYHPLTEDSVPMSERVPRFERWVSAYYDHSAEALDTHDTSLLDISPLPYPTPSSMADRPATLEDMDPAEKQAMSWPKPITSSELFLYTMPPEILLEHTRLALMDKDAAKTLPRCRLVLVWCRRTNWASVAGAWDVERLVKEHTARGEAGRPLEIVELPWANHFVRYSSVCVVCR